MGKRWRQQLMRFIETKNIVFLLKWYCGINGLIATFEKCWCMSVNTHTHCLVFPLVSVLEGTSGSIKWGQLYADDTFIYTSKPDLPPIQACLQYDFFFFTHGSCFTQTQLWNNVL